MRQARVDANQTAIVRSLRDAKATVQHLHAVGQGCPDILVGYRGKNYLMEIKDGSKVPSARAMTAPQIEWHNGWRGQVAVVTTVAEALAVLGIST